MNHAMNPLGQPVGAALPNWKAPEWPVAQVLAGRFCRLAPLSVEAHAPALYRELAVDAEGRTWTYLPYGPFGGFEEFRGWLASYCLGRDPFFYTILDASSSQPLGLASYLRINPGDGVIEVGHLIFSARLQRTAAATEAMHLLMKQAFELGYRRYEWKCDSLNAKSRAAAERLGFQFEGIFRQDRVYKGRSRDTAWLSVIDREWPGLERAFTAWLSPENFDEAGRQKAALSAFRR
jgi:RimJ/RimL family protein N-acetyltransferase